MKRITTTMLAALLPITALAAPWQNSIEAGYSKSSGNSDVESIYLAAESHYKAGLYGADARLKTDRQTSGGQITKEYYKADAKAKRYLTSPKGLYFFGNGQWEKDEIAGLISQWTVTLGPGYHWALPHKQTLDMEIGAGYQSSDYQNDAQDTSGSVGQVFIAYAYPINSAVTLKADTLSQINSDRHQNTSHLKAESALSANLSLTAEFEYRYNSEPDTGKRKEDTTTRLTLKYAF